MVKTIERREVSDHTDSIGADQINKPDFFIMHVMPMIMLTIALETYPSFDESGASEVSW